MTDTSTGPGTPAEPGAAADEAAASSEPARVQVVRGEPDDVELAALVAGLVAVSGSPLDDDDEAHRASAWSDRSRALGAVHPPPPGPHTWRWSLHR